MIQETNCYKVAIENYSSDVIRVNTNECNDNCTGLNSETSFKLCKLKVLSYV